MFQSKGKEGQERASSQNIQRHHILRCHRVVCKRNALRYIWLKAKGVLRCIPKAQRMSSSFALPSQAKTVLVFRPRSKLRGWWPRRTRTWLLVTG